MSFDPWTATQQDAEQQPDAFTVTGAYFQWVEAQAILTQREFFELNPLRAVAQCLMHGLPVPDWITQPFLAQVAKVGRCDVGSWDDAFGRPFKKGEHRNAAKLRQRYGRVVPALFSPVGRLPRTQDGYEQAATMLGLTIKQIKDLLPKTRTNTRGRKPYASHGANIAHDPFSMAKKKPKF